VTRTETPPRDEADTGDDEERRGGNALVLASDGSVARSTLADVTGANPAVSNAVTVTYHDDLERWLNDWYDEVGALAGDLVVVAPRAFARAGPATSDPTTHTVPGLGTVEAIGDPTNLAVVGCRVREHLLDWSHRPRETLVSFETVGALLDRFSRRTTFRFLHLVTHESRTAGAHGWFYLDPAAHDEVTVRTLAPLFKTVVERRNGDWTATQP
jgi:hypothetical protein